MKKFLAITVCKLLRIIGKAIGKGSSLPGKFALKICPDILSHLTMPQKIIAVTGSNGKTSTVEMIAHVLKENGVNVIYNAEGSNQIEGVTTFILCNATLTGRVKTDVLLIESDERYAKYTFNYFTPTHYVITNLYRDQLTRNGHPMWVFEAIKQSLHSETQLILNADDPLVSLFGFGAKNTVWFGADRLVGDTEQFCGAYNDGVYCPVCHAKLDYAFYHYNHIGNYRCTLCDFGRHDTDFTVTSADLKSGYVVINEKYKIDLALKSIYNIYNILATFSVAALVGLDKEGTAASLNNYALKNGRIVEFKIGEREGTLLVSKHENSISYDQSLKVAVADDGGCDVIVIVDAISRKYFTSDVSWLYDINFEMLSSDNVKHIVLTGTYANDLAVRMHYTNIDKSKIIVNCDIDAAVKSLDNGNKEHIYAITCFSDKEKLLERVN